MELLGALKVAFPLGLEAAVIADLGAWEGVQHHPPQPQASECQKMIVFLPSAPPATPATLRVIEI